MHDVFLKRVRIRNYKSIAECDVELGWLTLVVGRNGAGKSNFLDALRFVADSLDTSLDHALRARGGLAAVRRISTGHPRNFQIQLTLNIDRSLVEYEFEVGARQKGEFFVKREQLKVTEHKVRLPHSYTVQDGVVTSSSVLNMPPASLDRLFLVVASGLPQFRPVYDALTGMGFYNLNPDQIRDVQTPDSGELLRRDGSNLASVISRLSDDRPETKARIREYLALIVPEIEDFNRVAVGHQETLEFRQRVEGAEHPWKFYAGSMSDGTLRTLGILTAVMQIVDRKETVRLVGIEEPETALHPAAAGALMDALREAAATTQVVVTTHSPDLLDRFDPNTDTLLAVAQRDGTTEIGPADQASIESIREHLFTAGELLRMDQLAPAPVAKGQLSLFSEAST